MAKWIQKATAKMKKKGTLGSFGKATPKKISAAKKKGGKAKKKAIFAGNMKKIARRRIGKGRTRRHTTRKRIARKRA